MSLTTGILNHNTMKTILLIVSFSILNLYLYAQGGVAINNDGSTAHQSAILDVSSTTKGFVAPRMLTNQRENIGSPTQGLLVYDTDLNGYYQYRNAVTIQGPPGAGGSINLVTGWYEVLSAGFVGITELYDGKYDGWNVFLGFWAGRNASNTTDCRNNIALGLEALTTMTTGKSNVALGNDALSNMNGTDANTGNNNTAVGRLSLSNITTGNNNTAIGFNAGPAAASLNNTVAIGAEASPTADNQIVLGTNSQTLITIPGLVNAAAAVSGDQSVYVTTSGDLVRGPALAVQLQNDTETIRSDIEILKAENAKLKAEMAELRAMIEALQEN
jgi:hypothetical protein